jgi:hypothetical protein
MEPETPPEGDGAPEGALAEGWRARIKLFGWGCGSVLSDDLRSKISWRHGADPNVAESLAIVVSHPCDILCDELHREPVVETILGRIVETRADNYLFGRNPRVLQLDIRRGAHKGRVLELRASDRGDLPRELLAGRSPEAVDLLSPSDIKAIVAWLARRQIRTAFPDEFIRRLEGKRKQIHKIQKRAGDRLAGIYIRVVNDDELTEDDDYLVVLYTVAASKHVSANTFKSFIAEVHRPLLEAFDKTEGIKIVSPVATTDRDFSLKDQNELDLFDLDFEIGGLESASNAEGG